MLYKTDGENPILEIELRSVNVAHDDTNPSASYVAHNVDLGHNLVRDVWVQIDK
jgi:hypothetical protein